MRPVTCYLSLEDLLTLAGDLRVGPVRDLGLVDAAAHRPQVEHYGVQAYQDLDTKAAVLLERLCATTPWSTATSASGGWPPWCSKG